jgi:hypothetical protein
MEENPMSAKPPASKPAFLSIRFKVLIPLMFLLTIIFCITYSASQSFLKTFIIRFMKQEAVYVRDNALKCIDPDMLGELTRDAQADPETDWRKDDRYIKLQECLVNGNINQERASIFTYYQTGENTFAYGIKDDVKNENPVPFGEEMTMEKLGGLWEYDYGLLTEGLLGEKVTDGLYYDEVADVNLFKLVSPIQNRSGKTIGGIVVLVKADEFIYNLDTLTIVLLGIFILIYVFITFIVLVVIGGATSQLHTLNTAAVRVAEGNYTPVKVKKQVVSDEVSNLARVFNIMLEKVRGREEILKKRVTELEIVIDSDKRSKQVKEIVDSEFFQGLTERAVRIRASRKRGDQEKKSGDDGK